MNNHPNKHISSFYHTHSCLLVHKVVAQLSCSACARCQWLPVSSCSLQIADPRRETLEDEENRSNLEVIVLPSPATTRGTKKIKVFLYEFS